MIHSSPYTTRSKDIASSVLIVSFPVQLYSPACISSAFHIRSSDSNWELVEGKDKFLSRDHTEDDKGHLSIKVPPTDTSSLNGYISTERVSAQSHHKLTATTKRCI